MWCNGNTEKNKSLLFTFTIPYVDNMFEHILNEKVPFKLAKVTNVVEENGRLKLVVQDDYYYDKAPCDGDLFAIYFIADTFNLLEDKSDLLGALLLTWLKNDKVKMTQKKTLFG